ncbi:MAG: hypothetical protein HYX88_00315 [Chloroflexi bacterium]|nr:hypothetical protein [Chloroflexota bacterium]
MRVEFHPALVILQNAYAEGKGRRRLRKLDNLRRSIMMAIDNGIIVDADWVKTQIREQVKAS